jgi:cell division protein FtsB
VSERSSEPGGREPGEPEVTASGGVHWSRAAVLRLAVASLVLIGALFLFVFPTSAVWHQHNQVSDAQERLSVLKQQNEKLASESKHVLSDEEIERLARDRFNMVRPGEQAWAIVPGATTTTTTTPPATTAPPTTPTTVPTAG